MKRVEEETGTREGVEVLRDFSDKLTFSCTMMMSIRECAGMVVDT